jgi:hypothetical protein
MAKIAPHFGHLIFVSLDTPAHPKDKTARSANAKKMLIHFLIFHIPPFPDKPFFNILEHDRPLLLFYIRVRLP